MVIADEIAICAEACGLPPHRVRELADFARERGEPLIDVLVRRGNVDEPRLLHGIAEQLDLRFQDREAAVPPEVLAGLSPALAIRHHVIPLGEADGGLRLGCADPFDWRGWDELCHVVARPLERVLCPRPVIARMLKTSYGIGADTVQRLLADRDGKQARSATGGAGKAAGIITTKTPDMANEQQAANEPTVVNLLNQVLIDAIRAGATDIHFEPFDGRYRVRYRVDGMLEDVSMPASVNVLRLALVSRVKIMCDLDITERRLPQDGRCQVAVGGQDYDLRVSILPGVHGEGVNVRLQSRQMVRLDLEALGFEPDERAAITRLVGRPHGLILVTGPTGSGKTTTLYTCLARVNTAAVKVITIEDPVEYRTEDVLQMQVHEEIGFSFGRALRSMLRHDPDVMLVGEVRDRDTADIAIRSSLTGHLVFATLHTNDAASAFTRLIDIGVEPFLVASSAIGVIAQRLVRKVCDRCAEAVPARAIARVERDLLWGCEPVEGLTVREGRRCEHCRFTGYRGRTVISEVLPVTPPIRRLVQERQPSEQIREQACLEGMRTLRQSALAAVRSGRTTAGEAIRVTQEDA